MLPTHSHHITHPSLSLSLPAADSIRAHLWSQVGRSRLLRSAAPAHAHATTTTTTSHTAHNAGPGGPGSLKSPPLDPLALFLSDLHLPSALPVLRGLGFTQLQDLVGLSREDCQTYFPFLLPGDLLRLGRAVEMLGREGVGVYVRRAEEGLLVEPLPPRPDMR